MCGKERSVIIIADSGLPGEEWYGSSVITANRRYLVLLCYGIQLNDCCRSFSLAASTLQSLSTFHEIFARTSNNDSRCRMHVCMGILEDCELNCSFRVTFKIVS